MEYILPHYGGGGQSFVYELLFNGEDDDRPQMCGLLDMTAKTSSITKRNFEHRKRKFEPPTSIQRARFEHGPKRCPAQW